MYYVYLCVHMIICAYDYIMISNNVTYLKVKCPRQLVPVTIFLSISLPARGIPYHHPQNLGSGGVELDLWNAKNRPLKTVGLKKNSLRCHLVFVGYHMYHCINDMLRVFVRPLYTEQDNFLQKK